MLLSLEDVETPDRACEHFVTMSHNSHANEENSHADEQISRAIVDTAITLGVETFGGKIYPPPPPPSLYSMVQKYRNTPCLNFVQQKSAAVFAVRRANYTHRRKGVFNVQKYRGSASGWQCSLSHKHAFPNLHQTTSNRRHLRPSNT